MFCPLGNASSQRVRGSSAGGRVAVSLLPRHVQGGVGQVVIPTRSHVRTGFSSSTSAQLPQQRHFVVAPGYAGHGARLAKSFTPSVSPTRSPPRFNATPRTASPVCGQEPRTTTSGSTRPGELSTMYVARGRAAAVERSRSCSDMSRGASNGAARSPRSAGSKGYRTGSGVRAGVKEKITQPRSQLSLTRRAVDSAPSSAGAEPAQPAEPAEPKKPLERGPGTSPQRRAGEVTCRKEAPKDASVFRWQGIDDVCRQEIQAAVQEATARWRQEREGPRDNVAGSHSSAGLPPTSPAPSTVDMRGSLELPSSAPSPLSGGGAWELSDSSHHSLNVSTNSSSQQEDASDINDAPPEYLVPTPRRFEVNAHFAGPDRLAQTMKTVSTMRSFWENKARENAGSKEGEREARWSRLSNVEPTKNSQGPVWLKKELTKLQAHVDANKERLLELSVRLHGQDNCLDDEHSTRCSRSPSSKSSCTISSDSDMSKSHEAPEDDELLTSLKSLRRDFSKVNRKTAALFEEVLERCLPKEKLRIQESLAAEAHSLQVAF